MSLEDTLEADLKIAMKTQDSCKLLVLRMVKAAALNYKIEKKKEKLDDTEMIQILQKQAKLRKESLESYNKAGRTELAEKEQKELAVLETYLPKQLGTDEITAILKKAIEKTGAKSKAETGKIMKEVMPELKGKADGKIINEILSTLLA